MKCCLTTVQKDHLIAELLAHSLERLRANRPLEQKALQEQQWELIDLRGWLVEMYLVYC